MRRHFFLLFTRKKKSFHRWSCLLQLIYDNPIKNDQRKNGLRQSGVFTAKVLWIWCLSPYVVFNIGKFDKWMKQKIIIKKKSKQQHDASLPHWSQHEFCRCKIFSRCSSHFSTNFLEKNDNTASTMLLLQFWIFTANFLLFFKRKVIILLER